MNLLKRKRDHVHSVLGFKIGMERTRKVPDHLARGSGIVRKNADSTRLVE